MHVDDDPPSEELQLLYTRALERGVQIRRMVFYRDAAQHGAYAWIAHAPTHPNLQHRIVEGPGSDLMSFSFAVADEETLLVAVPGYQAVDSGPLAERLVFRHLLVIRNLDAVRAFVEMYEKLWQRASPASPCEVIQRGGVLED